MLLLSSADFFFKINVFKRGMDPDQDGQSVGPDLSPNCLQRISALSRDDKSCR